MATVQEPGAGDVASILGPKRPARGKARRRRTAMAPGTDGRVARLMSASPAVIYSFEATGDFAPTFVSDNIRDLFGYEPSEYLESPDFWRDCVHPDDLAAVEAEAARLFQHGRHTVEYRFRRKDGTYRWVNDEQCLILGGNGASAEIVGSWSDITDRRNAQNAARAAQDRVDHLLATSPAVIYSFKATGDFAPTFISRNLRDLLGYDREEYLASPDFWREHIHPADSPRVLGEFARLIQTGRLTYEYRFRKKDGAYCWISDDLHLLRDAGGNPVEVVGAWSDVTARKQLGEVAVAAQNRLVHLLSSARAVIYSYKAYGDFAPTFVSENITDLLGYQPREYLEGPNFWWGCVHPDDLAVVEAAAVQLFRKGQHTLRYRFRKQDGSWCWVNDEQRLVRDQDGQPEEVVGSWTDITERMAVEEAVAAARARLEHLVASAPAVIYSFKATGDFAPTFISQNIKDLLGYDREEYLESPDFWVSRVHPEDSPRILRAYERLMDVGRLSSEYRFRKKDGSYCWVSDELQGAARCGRESGRGRGRLERRHRPQAAGRGAGRRARPAGASSLVRTGGDLQLQGDRQFRADLREPEHPRLARLRSGGISRGPGLLAPLRPPGRVGGGGGRGGPSVPQGPTHRRVPVSAQGRQLLLGQRRAASDPRP